MKSLVKATKAALQNPSDKVIWFGHSFGARAIAKMLRELGDDEEFRAAVPPERVAPVLTGNPERRHGGACWIPGTGVIPGYGGNGVPPDTDYPVWDIANQYGYMENHPQKRSVSTAV